MLGFLAGIPFTLEIDNYKYKFVEHEEDVDDLRCNVQCGHHKKLLCCREKNADILKQLGNHFVNQRVKFESIVSCLLANLLDQLIDETLEREDKFQNSDSILRSIFESDEGGYEEIIHLFRILKKIVRIFGEEFSDACIKFFEIRQLL